MTGSFIQFLGISQGSLKEFETHVILSNRIGFMLPVVADGLLSKTESLGKALRALIRSLQAREKS